MISPITFGKYLLLERINVGGMAEVFKAKAFGVEGFERIIAIKRILPNMAEDDEFINMFVDEARISVQLSHANIVQIYELGRFENQYYIAMEYVSGKDLRQILDRYRKKKQTLSLPATAYLTCKICEGLDYAHRKSDPTGRPLNLIHRDVSPQNILVSYEGAVKVTDFGIAKAEDRASKTQAGVLKGKFGYMSPEQVRGLDIDHRSDIFALGILMYEMLTGKRLFIGESDFSTLEKVRNAQVVPPSQHNPDIPPELERIVLRALAKERDDRYQWASELYDDLQQYLIEDNTIYNAKRLAAALREDFAADIEAEMQKMDEFMRMPSPQSPEALAAAADMARAPVRSGNKEAVASGEKTMIFESGFAELSNAPTMIGEEAYGGRQGSVRTDAERQTGSLVINDAGRRGSSGISRPSVKVQPIAAPRPRVPVVAGIAGALVVLVLLAVLFMGGGKTGTIIVVTTPIDTNLEILVDGKKLGDRSPLIREDIEAGEHLVQVRAPGYQEKAFTVNVVAGQASHLPVDFGVPEAATAGEVVVSSDPPGATVIADGQERGTTPLTLREIDTRRVLSLLLQKEGFQSKMLTASFTPGNPRTSVSATLEALDGAAKGARGRVFVESTPSEATVYVNKRKKGVTPLQLDDLDPRHTVELRVTKTGYRPATQTIKFDGQLELRKSFTLSELGQGGSEDDGGQQSAGVGKGGEVKQPDRQPRGGGACSGDGATISVNVAGESSCQVFVGAKKIGETPIFKKPAPTGRCDIKITCPSGKSYKESRQIKSGAAEKLIVRPDQLQ